MVWNRSENTLLYLQLYDYYKALILSGKMGIGAKLPSIRKCAAQLQVSRTTVEMAYLLLAADGYIVSRPQSGYYVTELWQEQKTRKEARKKEMEKSAQDSSAKQPEIMLDFSVTSGGQESFNLDLWRRYVKSALRQSERMISYGDPQGESDLRQVLSAYLTETRNVVCSPERIVIGAGFQSLLHILCPLIRERKKIYFMDAYFKKGKAIFEDHGFSVMETQGGSRRADILYVTPSHLNRWGDMMSVSERFRLLRQVEEQKCLLIEDDYDSEFAYLNHPAPALQGLDGGNQVVYLGTFSRMLLPSIRISFMILTDELIPVYQKRKALYNQTVSKADQIALCQYIRDWHLQYQIRKTRKQYEEKMNQFFKQTKEILKVSQEQSGLLVKIELPSDCSVEELDRRMKQQGIQIGILPEEKENKKGIYLSCSAVPEKNWQDALKKLAVEIKNA